MVAQDSINVCETVGRKNNCKVNFFSMYFIRTKEEIIFFYLQTRVSFIFSDIFKIRDPNPLYN